MQNKYPKKMLITLSTSDSIDNKSSGEICDEEIFIDIGGTKLVNPSGLFSTKIFGSLLSYKCPCQSEQIRIRKRCPYCDTEYTDYSARNERFGNIKLVVPVHHPFYRKKIKKEIDNIPVIPPALRNLKLEGIIIQAKDIFKEKGIRSFLIKNDEMTKFVDSEKYDQESISEKGKSLFVSFAGYKKISKYEFTIKDLNYYYCEILENNNIIKIINNNLDLIKYLNELNKSKLEKIVKILTSNKKSFDKLQKIRKDYSSIINKLDGIENDETIIKILKRCVKIAKKYNEIAEKNKQQKDNKGSAKKISLNNKNKENTLDFDRFIDASLKYYKNELSNAVKSLFRANTNNKNYRKLKSFNELIFSKSGLIRQNILGKRVDYSGRSVITVDPSLKISQCGLPFKIAVKLFEPYLINYKDYEKYKNNNKGNDYYSNIRFLLPPQACLFNLLEDLFKDKVILLIRQPTLHRMNVQAFYPKLVSGNTIRIHPLICKAYAADIDGDCMAVHLPISNEAQEEAKRIMLSGNYVTSPKNGMPIISPTQDIILGIYYLTKNLPYPLKTKRYYTTDEIIIAVNNRKIDIHEKVRVKIENSIRETTPGRIIFNNVLPKEYKYINKTIKGIDLEKIIFELNCMFSNEIVLDSLEKIKLLGFDYATDAGISIGLDKLELNQSLQSSIINEISNEILNEADLQKLESIVENKKLQVLQNLKDSNNGFNPLHIMVDSGARGSEEQIMKMIGMIGRINLEIKNKAIVKKSSFILNNFEKGLDIIDYFKYIIASRRTLASKKDTENSGYLGRRLIFLLEDTIIEVEDCNTKSGLTVNVDYDKSSNEYILMTKLFGRYTLRPIINQDNGEIIIDKNNLIDYEKLEKIKIHKVNEITVRSPLCCEEKKGICQKCYGMDLANYKKVSLGTCVGVIAAQSVTEPLTQMVMKSFHSGGIYKEVDVVDTINDINKLLEFSYRRFFTDIFSHEKLKDIFNRNDKNEIKYYEKLAILDILSNFYEKNKVIINQKHLEIIVKFINITDKIIILDTGGLDLISCKDISKELANKINIIKNKKGKNFEVTELPALLEINKILDNQKKPLMKFVLRWENIFLNIKKDKSFLKNISFEKRFDYIAKIAKESGAEDEFTSMISCKMIGKKINAGTNFNENFMLEQEPAKNFLNT